MGKIQVETACGNCPIKSDLKIRHIEFEDATAIANLHLNGIPTGFLSSLGLVFLRALYETIASSKYAFGYVAEKDSKILGFVFFSTDITSLYKNVIRRRFIKFTFLIISKWLTVAKITDVLQTLFYPYRIRKLNLPKPCLIAMAVDQSVRRLGLGTKLVMAGLEECSRRNIKEIRLLTSAANIPAINLYKKCGFEFAAQFKNHGILSNFYIKDLDARAFNLFM